MPVVPIALLLEIVVPVPVTVAEPPATSRPSVLSLDVAPSSIVNASPSATTPVPLSLITAAEVMVSCECSKPSTPIVNSEIDGVDPSRSAVPPMVTLAVPLARDTDGIAGAHGEPVIDVPSPLTVTVAVPLASMPEFDAPEVPLSTVIVVPWSTVSEPAVISITSL